MSRASQLARYPPVELHVSHIIESSLEYGIASPAVPDTLFHFSSTVSQPRLLVLAPWIRGHEIAHCSHSTGSVPERASRYWKLVHERSPAFGFSVAPAGLFRGMPLG